MFSPSILSALAALAAALSFSCAASEALTPTSAPVPVERFFQRPAVVDAELSPDGRRLAITTSRGNERVGLTVYEFGVGATRVAQFSNIDVVRFHWVGDSRLVFSVQDLEAGSGKDEREQPGLFAVGADGKDMRTLIRRKGRSFVNSSDPHERSLDWSHELLHVPLQQEGLRPNEVIVGQYNAAGFKEPASVTPLWLDTVSGLTRPFDTQEAPAGIVSWMFDSKGQPRVAVSHQQGRSQLYGLVPGAAQWRQIGEGSLSRLPFTPWAVEDSGVLYGTVDEGSEGYAVLTRFDFETMKPRPEPLLRAPGFDVGGSLVLDGAGSRALGVRVETEVEQTIWFDPAMKQFQAEVDAKLAGRVNRISCVRCGEPGRVALVLSHSDRDPGVLLVHEAATQRWSRIGDVLDGIEPQRMASVQLQRIKARDGRDLPVWLTLPAQAVPGRALPTVVMVHGGPWVRGGFWRWEPMAQFLASRGYLVISPEFRGSTGYGFAHFQAGWKQWGQAMQDDVADALLWARQQGLADKERACIAGASYGGYSTLMGLVRHPELYRCGVAWVAVTDPFLYLEGGWFVDDDIGTAGRRHVLPELVGDAEKDKAMLTANSPLAQAARIRAPLLLGFGESDRRVPLAHGKRLRDALSEAGRPPEWVSYANEGHSWRMPKTQIDWANRVEEFLGKHLKAPKP